MSGKPLGIGIGASDGALHFFVRPIDRTVDQIWDAVREAINTNMLPEQFKREVADAWEYHLKEDAKWARKELEGK